MKVTFLTLLTVIAFAAQKGKAPAKKADEKKSAAMVFFEEPQDGATVPAKFTVKMGVMGYEVKPAGDKTPNSGHHHILVDTPAMEKGQAIPMGSPKHLHFGKGQHDTEVELSPGKHTLTLQFADMNHISYGPEMSSTITVNVQEAPKK